MMISTRGRYALRFLVDLAEQQVQHNGGFTTMKDVAERQEVSPKYAERLFATLSRKKFVDTQHGKGGGYRLSRPPEDYRVSEVLRAMDEELAPVACLSCRPNLCHRAQGCKTLPMWQKLDGIINSFFDEITIADLMNRKI